MTEILDIAGTQEIAALYLADGRVPHPTRPWVTMGMIASVDGAISVGGRSSALGGPPDRAVFRALRATADVVLVGASTLRVERYRAVRLPDPLVAWRRERGMPDSPRVAVVSRSLDFELSASLALSRPYVLTCDEAPAGRLAELGDTAEVIVYGSSNVDLPGALSELRRRGVDRVTLEGGPTLNGEMVDLIDEACVTIAPVIVGGTADRMVGGIEALRTADLARLIHSEGYLLARYLLQ